MADGALRRYGAVPVKGAHLRLASYRTGGGRRGNVSARAISVLKSSIPFVSRVENRRPARGGVDGEDIENAKVRGPIRLRTRGRAVTTEDFEHLAREAAPEVARIRAVAAGDGADAGSVRVLVVPAAAPADGAYLRFDQLVPGEETLQAITDRLGNDGYSFANVNPVPELDREKRIAGFTFFVDPGRRVYVRRVNISGNTKTQDEVIRRELRQLESSWYSLEKIARSKERLQRTGYFSDVTIDTPAVPGTTDQVDINVTVVERNTGTLNFGLGYSAAEKLTVSASVSQANILGTGNSASIQLSNGAVNKIYSFSYVNPYWTPDGISRGFDIFRRDVNTSTLDIAQYNTYSTGAGIRFGVPVSEFDTVNAGFTVERTRIVIDSSAPQRYQDFVNEFGEDTNTFRTNLSYSRDSRDSLTWPTKGWLNEIGTEIGMPPGDLKYYRLNYQSQAFYTPRRIPWLTFMANAELGYASGYGGKPLPFFKNFYAGGVGSVRAFETATLGPRDTNGDVLGGNRRIIGNLEALFPMPGWKEKNVRLGGFIDFGNVWGEKERISASDIRVSAGFAVSWDSPVGPLRFSFGFPVRSQPEDKIERFQFQLGRIF